MAKKRMFNNTVLDTDAFLDLPLSAQALYFHLNMRADDDGFISNPKRIQKYIGASEDDLKILIMKRFLITFEDGVVVIKHWRMHNTIRSDRYIPTNYQEDFKLLGLKKNSAYTLETECQPNGNQLATNCVPLSSTDIDIDIDIGIDKDIKDIVQTKRFQRPTIDDIKAYCIEKGYNVDAQTFIDYYDSNGWKVGRNSMEDWKATVRRWNAKNMSKGVTKNKFINFEQRDDDLADIEAQLDKQFAGI